MKKSAFTLIEVMVVLSILAIIAILGYNFFGSTMKEAKLGSIVTQIHKDLGALNDGLDMYRLKYGTNPPGDDLDVLVDEGILKTVLQVPETDRVGPYSNYQLSTAYWDFTNDGVDDDVLLVGTSVEVCDEYNRRFTPYGSAWDYQAEGNASPNPVFTYCEAYPNRTAPTQVIIYRTVGNI